MTVSGRVGAGILAVVWVVLCGSGPQRQDYSNVEPLLDATETVMGERLVYPSGQAEVVSMIVTMGPGEETGRHQHPVPIMGYVLEGEVTVDYEGRGSRTYRKGEAFLEAMHVWHNGRNTGSTPVRLLAVFMSAVGDEEVKRPQ